MDEMRRIWLLVLILFNSNLLRNNLTLQYYLFLMSSSADTIKTEQDCNSIV